MARNSSSPPRLQADTGGDKVKRKYLKSKVIVDHVSNCHALYAVKTKQCYTPWSGVIEESYFGNALGARRNGYYYWHVIACNDTGCPARKIVNSEVLNRA